MGVKLWFFHVWFTGYLIVIHVIISLYWFGLLGRSKVFSIRFLIFLYDNTSSFSFFFFWRKQNWIFINQQKLLSLSTSWVTSLGTSSNHIRGAWKNFAIFASLSATPFPLCLPSSEFLGKRHRSSTRQSFSNVYSVWQKYSSRISPRWFLPFESCGRWHYQNLLWGWASEEGSNGSAMVVRPEWLVNYI